VDAAHQRIGQRVRGRESGEVCEHHLAHVHGVHHRLKEDALVLDLRADHDEEAGDDQPGAVQQHAGHHGRQRQHLAYAAGRPGRWSETELAGIAGAKQPPGVQWVRRQQMQKTQTRLHPHHAAYQHPGGDPRLGKEFYISAGAKKRRSQQQRRGHVCHGTGQRHGKLSAALAGAFLTFRVRVGKHSADGQQQNGAQPQTQPCRYHQPRRLAHYYCGHQHKKQSQAAPNAVGTAQRQANQRQKRKEKMDANLDAHPTTKRN
jgi:hypothetical protein